MIKYIVNWFKNIVYEEYELTVWFQGDTEIVDGVKQVTPKTKKTFRLKAINKRNQKHITGKDLKGRPFEIRTVEPFDFYIRKIH